jgi:hypothetical protein
MEPASTAATTTFFLHALSATNGFGFRAGVASGVKPHGNSRHRSVRVGSEGAILGTSEVDLPRGGRRWRGGGRGRSGKTSNKAVSSYKEGIRVVRALIIQ